MGGLLAAVGSLYLKAGVRFALMAMTLTLWQGMLCQPMPSDKLEQLLHPNSLCSEGEAVRPGEFFVKEQFRDLPADSIFCAARPLEMPTFSGGSLSVGNR